MRRILLCSVALTVTLSVAPLGAPAVTHAALHASVAVKPKLSLTVPPTAQTQTLIRAVVRTVPRIAVHLRATFAGETFRATQYTGIHGWTRFIYDVPFSAHPGTAKITVRAAVRGSKSSVTKRVLISPFVPVVKAGPIQVLEQTSGGWVPASHIRAGETVRLVAPYTVTEVAGTFAPPCVSGTLELGRGGNVLATLPTHCPVPQPANSLPYVYSDITMTPDIGVGSLTALFSLSYDEGMYGIAYGQTSAVVTVGS